MAGLLDGEGNIARQKSGAWRVEIGMTDQRVVEWLTSHGGTFSIRMPSGNRKHLYLWRLLRQMDVLRFLEAVKPYLMVKNAVVDEAIFDIQKRAARPAVSARRGIPRAAFAAETRRRARIHAGQIELPEGEVRHD